MIWLFDIDGTLIRSGGAGSLAMSWALAEAFSVVPKFEKIVFSGRTDLGITRDLFNQHAIEFSPTKVQRFYQSYLSHLPEALRQKQGEVLPGVRHLLTTIAAVPQAHLGLLTGNMEPAAQIKLGHYNLDHFFSFGGYGGASTHRNEVARQAFESIPFQASAVDRDRVWVVGDTPLDIECARSQRLKVIGVATGGHQRDELALHAPDLLLEDLRDHGFLFELGLLPSE